MVFWPAVNGEDNAPYGGFDYDTEYVFQAYITDYDGTYDGIWQYDIGLVTFKDPIGDSLGWLGYTGERHRRFPGHPRRLSRRQAGLHHVEVDLQRACRKHLARPTSSTIATRTNGTDGAPLYYYDQANKGRMVVGINIGPSGDANWALKLNPALVAWINSVNQ